jgi:uncharacterized membrane protein
LKQAFPGGKMDLDITEGKAAGGMSSDLKERLISAVSYLWILFFLTLVIIPESGFGRFHANQALLNLLWGIVFGLLSNIAFGWLFNLILAVYPLWGIATALMGLEKPFPIIGNIRLIK